jgi:hypothetical protein
MRRARIAVRNVVEIRFSTTPSGDLVRDQIVLHAANENAEAQLRWFLESFRDPSLDNHREGDA